MNGKPSFLCSWWVRSSQPLLDEAEEQKGIFWESIKYSLFAVLLDWQWNSSWDWSTVKCGTVDPGYGWRSCPAEAPESLKWRTPLVGGPYTYVPLKGYWITQYWIENAARIIQKRIIRMFFFGFLIFIFSIFLLMGASKCPIACKSGRYQWEYSSLQIQSPSHQLQILVCPISPTHHLASPLIQPGAAPGTRWAFYGTYTCFCHASFSDSTAS